MTPTTDIRTGACSECGEVSLEFLMCGTKPPKCPNCGAIEGRVG